PSVSDPLLTSIAYTTYVVAPFAKLAHAPVPPGGGSMMNPSTATPLSAPALKSLGTAISGVWSRLPNRYWTAPFAEQMEMFFFVVVLHANSTFSPSTQRLLGCALPD